MPALTASAPGKIILFGEHAVVYNRPAIAVPVLQVSVKASIFADPLAPPHTVWISAPDVGLDARLEDLEENHPIRVIFRQVMQLLNIREFPSARIKITTTLPVASGLGSSSASSVALIRVISAFLGRPFPDEVVNRIAFETEKIHHGTPSGIDNTVTTYARPIFYIKDKPIEWLESSTPMIFVIGDSGVASSTATVVADLRRRWMLDTAAYEKVFDDIANCTLTARQAMKAGNTDDIGRLMTQNHRLLQTLDVSSTELDALVDAAMSAGALGAKMSGGGRGGNMIALAKSDQDAAAIAAGLQASGAARTLVTTVPPSKG